MAGTYWLTVLPDTSKLKPAINAAMRGVKINADFGVDEQKARNAAKKAAKAAESELDKSKPKLKPEADKAGSDRAGQEAGKRVSAGFRKTADGDKVGREFATGMTGGIRSVVGKLGPLLGGLSIAGGLGSSIKEGMNFTETLNVMQGVTSASGDQIKKVSDLARQLGTDVNLAGINANDAATAMTELAKGGMDVDKSMAAVRGTLALASAANLDAASAATIQSDALNMFQIQAKDSTRVADLLVNAANASSSDVPQMAQALAQAGSAAAGFGVSIEDTLTSLAMFSNFGIKGSDAGTLMKSSLIAITDGGKPATEAMNALGLQLYDSQGVFKGYPEMLRQVAEASKRMSEEQFQGASAVLFGSDALRGAMVAANGGSDVFNATADAVVNGAGAIQMASTRMQGLPGAWGNFTNMLDNAKMSVYDIVDGPLESLLKKLMELPGFISRNADVFKIIAGVITTIAVPALVMWIAAQTKAIAVSAVKGITDLVGAWGKLGGKILDAVANIVYYTLMQGKALAGNVAGALSTVAGAFTKVGTAAKAAGIAMLANPVGLIIAGFVALGVALWAFFTKTETGRKWWAAIWSGIKTAASVVWEFIKGALSTLGNAIAGIWNFIQPAIMAFAKLGAAVGRLSFEVIMAGIRLLGNLISWLWQNIAVPAFQAIGAVLSNFWSAAKVVWDAFQMAVQWVGDKISWLWQNIAVPAFEAIAGAVSSFWNVVRPIWDLLVTAFDKVSERVGKIKDAFVTAFNKIKEVVTGVWDSIGGIFDKVSGGINRVADIVSGIGGNADGGVANGPGYFNGGRISGPGGGRSDSILGLPAMVRVSNGEYIVNAEATAKNLPLLNALNAGALPGFASGGLTPHGSEMKNTISRMFGVSDIGGFRESDGYNEHSTGNALDVMIPNSDTDQGKALGDSVTAWALKNAKAIGLTGAIWRQTSYGYGGGFDGTGKAMEDRGDPTQNHYDHVHLFMNEKPDKSLSLSGAPSISSSIGASASAGGSYRSATSSELSASSGRVSSAGKAVTQAEQRVEDRTFDRDQAQKRLDAARAAGKDTTEAERSLYERNRELADATEALTETRTKLNNAEAADTELRTKGKMTDSSSSSGGSADGSGSSSGGDDFGQMFMSGLLESVGLDGSLFSNPLEWPSVKSIMAGVNYVGGLLSTAGVDPNATTDGTSTVSGVSDVADATGVGGMLSTISGVLPGNLNPGVNDTVAVGAPGVAAPHTGTGSAPGPAIDNSININGPVGMAPVDVQNKLRTESAARTRTTKVNG